MCYNGFTIKINLFKSKKFKDEGVPTKILGRTPLATVLTCNLFC